MVIFLLKLFRAYEEVEQEKNGVKKKKRRKKKVV